MKKCLVFILVLILSGCGTFERESKADRISKIVESLSPYEREVLSCFFHFLLEEECCGFSLYGEKPLCVQEFMRDEIPLGLNEFLIKRSCLFREGIKLWNKSGLSLINSNFAIHASQIPDSDGWLDLFFINKKSFQKTIDQNLTLFQYVLGPEVSSVSLLKQFLNPNQNLSSILCNDRVLIGVVLGYGVQNALHGSRLEEIHEERNKSLSTSKITPSFGFSDVFEEYDHLNRKLSITASRSDELPRLPWFSAIVHEETERLMTAYRANRNKLKNVLKSPIFLQECLSQFFNCRLRFTPSSDFKNILTQKLQNEKFIPIVLGQWIRTNLQNESATDEEFNSFIQGMLEDSTERENLSVLLRKHDANMGRQERESLLYRLGQKIRDQYERLSPIVSLEDVAASILVTNDEFDPCFREEIFNQINILALLSSPSKGI